MIVANQKRIEVAASPPCAEFRSRYRPPASKEGEQARVSGWIEQPWISISILIFTAMLVAFATNLSMHLLNLRMQAIGVSEFGIGIGVAIQALGIILMAPLAKHVLAAIGIRQSFVLGAFVASSTLISFDLLNDVFALSALRLLFAMGLALLFVISETLVITRADPANRGKLIGWYATCLAIGTASGPAFIAVTGIGGFAPLLWGAFFFWLTVVPVLLYVPKGQELAPVVRNSNFAVLRLVPIAFLTAFVFGIVDNGGLSMLSVYGTLVGYDYSQAALFSAIAMAGAIILQIPLGYAASNRDCNMVLVLCGVASIALLTLLPNIMAVKLAAFGTSFVLGGLLEGLYTIGLICIAKNYRNVGISSANGCFVSMCGFGEFVGPLATGTAINYIGPQGFIIGLTTMLALYVVFTVCLRQTV